MKNFFLIFFVIVMTTNSQDIENKNTSGYVEGEILLKFASNNQTKNVDVENNILKNLGLELIESITLNASNKKEYSHTNKENSNDISESTTILRLKFSPDKKMEDLLKELDSNANIEYAQPNFLYTICRDPDDLYYRSNCLWNMKQISAPQAWDKKREAKDIIIAVIDSGINYNHPDLKANMWTGPNGIHGYNYLNDNSDVSDEYGHGTHCAGIIGAVGNNNIGVVGVCWRTQIMALKFSDEKGEGDTSNAVKCIDFAVANGAKIISNSWTHEGTSLPKKKDKALQEAIALANKKGIIFVVAAGNAHKDLSSGNIEDIHFYPAKYSDSQYNLPNVVTVAASNKQDKLEYHSNYGAKHVHLAAPGEDIDSTIGIGMDSYGKMTGTSMAAPHVAGAMAIVWSYYPHYTHIEVINKVLSSVDKNRYFEETTISGGRLNLYKALLGKTTVTEVSNQKNESKERFLKLVEKSLDLLESEIDKNNIEAASKIIELYLKYKHLEKEQELKDNGQ